MTQPMAKILFALRRDCAHRMTNPLTTILLLLLALAMLTGAASRRGRASPGLAGRVSDRL